MNVRVFLLWFLDITNLWFAVCDCIDLLMLGQTNNLQWVLASVPLLKALQLTLSFLFWYVLENLTIVMPVKFVVDLVAMLLPLLHLDGNF